MVQDLERQVNELREQALIAKGETANLRRAATDVSSCFPPLGASLLPSAEHFSFVSSIQRQAVHEKRVEELTAEKEAALASVKRKERELQESESAKAVQKALEVRTGLHPVHKLYGKVGLSYGSFLARMYPSEL